MVGGVHGEFAIAEAAVVFEPLDEGLGRDHFVYDLVIADDDTLERRRRADRAHPPALEGLLDDCGVVHERELVVMTAACIRAAAGVRPWP